MDVRRILEELRSERQEIEQTILSLERSARHNPGATKAAQSVIEMKKRTAPDNASSRLPTRAIDALSST
jgi:hypothetical protein